MIVLIDDFKVPDDPGYRWDDYGQDMELSIDLLKEIIPFDGDVFFPSLPSSRETGMVRGCCVIAGDGSSNVRESSLLRGNTLRHWMSLEGQTGEPSGPMPGEHSQHPGSAVATYVPPNVLRLQLAECERDRAQRLRDVLSLTAEVKRLEIQLAECERDRAQRLRDVLTLTAEVKRLQLPDRRM